MWLEWIWNEIRFYANAINKEQSNKHAFASNLIKSDLLN